MVAVCWCWGIQAQLMSEERELGPLMEVAATGPKSKSIALLEIALGLVTCAMVSMKKETTVVDKRVLDGEFPKLFATRSIN